MTPPNPPPAPVAEAEERTADVVHLDAELLAEVGEAVAVAVVPPEPETEPAPEPQAAVEDGDAADDAHQAVEESELGEVIHRALSLGATSVQLAPQARGCRRPRPHRRRDARARDAPAPGRGRSRAEAGRAGGPRR